MNLTDNTAQNQFVSDFLLITDNDHDSYNQAKECVSHHAHLHEVSDCMRDQYEEAIASALEVLRESKDVQDVTVDLMAQLLQGWGTAPFDKIARHYMEEN